MNVKLSIARRYLFSKKSSNAINLITWVSMLGIGFGTAALILVLSVFNGLTGFIEGLFAAIDPDLKIVAADERRYFAEDAALLDTLRNHPDIAAVTRTVEGRVWFEYVDNGTIAVLKGVEPDFTAVNPLDQYVYGGNYTFAPRNGVQQAVIGSVVATLLKPNTEDELRPIRVSYIPQDASFLNPQRDIQLGQLFPSGYFSIQKEYDERYVFTDFDYVREHFELEGSLSAYEVRLYDIRQAESVKEDLRAQLSDQYEILTWYEQHATLYRVMKNEKYISYLILVLMLAIAAINIVGGLSMIVLEKTRDIAVLKSFGATQVMVRQVFQYVGLLVGGIGGGVGVVLAFLIGLGQKYFGFVKLNGGESFRVKAFPIELQWQDFALVFVTVMVLAAVASLYPARQAARIRVVEGLHE